MTLTDPASMTLIFEGNQDDSNINIGDIGFNFPFYNSTYRNNIFVGSNSYITFGNGSNQYSGLSHTTPGRGILITAGDRSYQRVYTLATTGEFHIRFEGNISTSGTIGNPGIVWEITLLESGDIKIETGICNDTNGISLVTDGSTNYTSFPISANSIVELRRRENGTYALAGPPTAPSNPVPSNATNRIDTTLTLLWDSSGDSFNLAFGQSNPPPIIATDLTTASYEIKHLTPGATYFWRVTATNSDGTTTGLTWSFTTTPPPLPIPSSPSNLRATAVTSSKVVLTWDASSNAEVYYVEKNGNYHATVLGTNYTDLSVGTNQSLNYRIKAWNSSGTSGASNVVDLITPSTQPLNSNLQAKVKFHLQQANTLVSQTILIKEYSNGENSLIAEQVNKCDTALNNTAPNSGNLIQVSQEVTDQDITVTTTRPGSTTTTTYGDRTKTTSRRPSYQQRLSNYYKEVETLAKILEVDLW
jgi:hypothetical protein